MPSLTLDRYDLVEELGRGGMSVVFRARDRQLDREVAVKVLHRFLADDADARQRLHREARAVARLHHPNIVEIYDSSEPGSDEAYLVTELIDGPTLRAWLERHGPPSLPEAGALLALALTRALRHAHEQGILHRDLKPENVMLTGRGQLKLMDFGIAQIMGGATRLTTTGALLGSPAHMAPEVIDGRLSDHRSDLFALGTILYWLLTGRLPFEAPNPSALFHRILQGVYEPPQTQVPALGNALARVVERALMPSVEARYQDVSEIERDLTAVLDAVGWPTDEAAIAQLLLDPTAFCAARRGPLVDRLLDEAREASAQGDHARATDRANRAAALDPERAEARALLDALARPPPRRRAVLRRLGPGVIGLAAIALAWWGRPPTGAPPEAGAPAERAAAVAAAGGPPPEPTAPPVRSSADPLRPAPGTGAQRAGADREGERQIGRAHV